MKKVTVIVNGRFHAFDYASVLQSRGLLHKLISSMPKSKARKFGIDSDKYRGFPVFEVMKVLWRRFFKRELPTIWYSKLFASTVERAVPSDTDVIISFAGYSLEVFESKRLEKAIKVLDRSSTHTLSNILLNRQAANYHNTPFVEHPKEFIQRELKEYDLADHILVPTSFVKQTFLDNSVKEEKLVQIPYAMSQKKFDPKVVKRYEKSPTVLFVGQLSARKGIKLLIDAMEEVVNEFSEYKLHLVGALNPLIDGDVLNKLWITYSGQLSGGELFEAYSRASVFCLPSYEEGLAYVLTESNQFGLPIVATPNSGALDAVSDTERLFLHNADDKKDLVDKLKQAIIFSQKAKSELSVFQHTLSSMTWQKYTDILIEKVISL